MANQAKQICPICKTPIDPGDLNILNLGSVSIHDVCATTFIKKKKKTKKQSQQEDPWSQ